MGAAESWAQTFTHPRVNDVGRELLKTIARLVPEGENTTPLIGMKALATQAHINQRTVWKWVGVFVEIGAVRVVDGGQGRPARYLFVQVAGAAPPMAAALPLRADLQPVARRPQPPSDTFDLFDEAPIEPTIVRSKSEELTIPTTIVRIVSSTIVRIVRIVSSPFVRSQSEELTIGTYDPRPLVRSNSEVLTIRTYDPYDPPEQLLSTARARAPDVHTLKNVHTHAAERVGPTDDEMRAWPSDKVLTVDEATAFDAFLEREPTRPPPDVTPPPKRHPWHAWCGLVCVPQQLHDDFRRKGHEEAWLVAFYARTCAALPAGEKIHVNDFDFWRPALKAELATTPPKTRPRNVSRHEGIGGSIACPHDEPKCATRHACIDRELADARARKTG